MLNIDTFDNLRGGNVAYKALSHPLVAPELRRLACEWKATGSVAVYDPSGAAGTLLALYPQIPVEGIYVHDSLLVGDERAGHITRPVTELPQARVATVLVASFDASRLAARLTALVPASARTQTLDAVRLPSAFITNSSRYLDAANFATNFALFRDDDRLGTRLTTANYWAGYGAKAVSLYFRLFDAAGQVLADWTQSLSPNAAGVIIDSAEVRRRFSLGPFAGQLFIHAIGAAGHDTLKYALDTYATDGGASLSSTHDANAWPAERYAGLPAPMDQEQVILWLQNCHADPIPAGALLLDEMGARAPREIPLAVPPFGTCAVDVGIYLPDVRWPAQIELLAGRHLVRPRYEVVRNHRTRIAHMNVQRTDLHGDPGIKALSPLLGRGFILPFPVLPPATYRTWVLPTPMAQNTLKTPLRIDIFRCDGTKAAERYIGALPRRHRTVLDLETCLEGSELTAGGHAELVYDFREGGDADGWMHALFRYERRDSGHVAESSFGAHIFNTAMCYRSEPQSYGGPPPGLSTKLYLKLGGETLDSFCVLIYPASNLWRSHSQTTLELYRSSGDLLGCNSIEIACSGSATIHLAKHFDAGLLSQAGAAGYVLVRDSTCRLFGFHGLDDHAGRFSFDHMFGF